ncbi:hypothetical protein J4444_04430 [Candidatus Woesearchaeota archaeon]|nr:hypothetical protein [Candidatus Woesearchaeota archaeon]
MHLLPSLKQKKRYIVFKIKSAQQFTFPEIREEVDKALLLFLGQLGVAKAAPMHLPERYNHNTFVLKVSNKYVDEVKSALILIKKIKNSPIILQSVITSGTLKKAGFNQEKAEVAYNEY